MIEFLKNFFRPPCSCSDHADFSRISAHRSQVTYKCNICGRKYKTPLRIESGPSEGRYATNPILQKYLEKVVNTNCGAFDVSSTKKAKIYELKCPGYKKFRKGKDE